MKKRISIFALATLVTVGMKAGPLKVCDFESYEIGTEWTLWMTNGGSGTSTARVEVDPTNTQNKVLHIMLKNWGCHPELPYLQTCGERH